MNLVAPDCKKNSNILWVSPSLMSKYSCSAAVFRVSWALYQFDFLLRRTISWYNAELVGIAGHMDNDVDFLFTEGVEFIPGNVFQIVMMLRFRNINGN